MNKQFEKFDKAMSDLLSVSHDDLKKREERWTKEHPKTGKKRGRKPKEGKG